MAKIDTCFGYKTTWFAIKNVKIKTILTICSNFVNMRKTTWKEGLYEVEKLKMKVLLSGEYEGWTFLIGKDLCNPSQPEEIIDLLLKFGSISEDVCYFSSYRTVELYGYAQVNQGKITRLYCYTGESGHIYKNIGIRTEAEKKLSLNYATCDEELFEEGFDELEEDDILRLAEQWSLNPEMLIGMEEKESIVADIIF